MLGIKTWKVAYKQTLTKKQMQNRLNELREWDKPLCTREEDPAGKWPEYDAKIEALESLLNLSPAQ